MQTLVMPVNHDDGRRDAADEPDYLSSKDAAERLDVTQGRIRQLLGEGKLSGIKDEKDDWLVELASVRKYRRYQQALDAAKNFMKGDADD